MNLIIKFILFILKYPVNPVRVFIRLILIAIFILPAPLAAQETIVISNARIREAPPNAEVTAGYFDIANQGPDAIILLGISSADYERVEMHRSIVSAGIAIMKLQQSVTIPANANLSFSPGDYHLMLYQPRKRFRTGESVTLLLQFKNGSEISVTAEVNKLHLHQH